MLCHDLSLNATAKNCQISKGISAKDIGHIRHYISVILKLRHEQPVVSGRGYSMWQKIDYKQQFNFNGLGCSGRFLCLRWFLPPLPTSHDIKSGILFLITFSVILRLSRDQSQWSQIFSECYINVQFWSDQL